MSPGGSFGSSGEGLSVTPLIEKKADSCSANSQRWVRTSPPSDRHARDATVAPAVGIAGELVRQ